MIANSFHLSSAVIFRHDNQVYKKSNNSNLEIFQEHPHKNFKQVCNLHQISNNNKSLILKLKPKYQLKFKSA